jgi:glucose-1-phosphate cytidylyltransferase
MIELLEKSGKTGCFLAVRPPLTFHLVEFDGNGEVQRMRASADSDIWINAGTSCSAKGFRLHQRGRGAGGRAVRADDRRGRVIAHRHDGFFRAMDTLRDKQLLEDMVQRGHMPWQPKLATLAPAEAAE